MKYFMKIFLVLSLFFMTAGSNAHDGKADSCGGHLNQETGEYHIHDYKKYRACLSRNEATEQAKKKMIFECGAKNSCEEMANCKEARFYFEKCGLTILDKDNTGIPCEKLCK
jgi:hypothetical protein